MNEELNEELNIDANKIKYEMIKYLNPYEHSTSAFMNVYIIKTNDVPDYNKNDFIDTMYHSRTHLFAKGSWLYIFNGCKQLNTEKFFSGNTNDIFKNLLNKKDINEAYEDFWGYGIKVINVKLLNN